MSSIGFRCDDDGFDGEGATRYRVIYFTQSVRTRPIESEDIEVVLSALHFDTMQLVVRAYFDELQDLMKRTFEAGMELAAQEFLIEYDLLVGGRLLRSESAARRGRFSERSATSNNV